MTAKRYDIKIEQGAKFVLNVQVKDGTNNADLTGYSARMQVRESIAAITSVLDATTANGRISINAPGGLVMVNIGSDITTLLTFNTGVYDLEIYTTTTDAIRLLNGNASLSLEVTR